MPNKLQTVQEILINATHILTATLEPHEARLQAELLFAHTLGISRANLLARLSDAVQPTVAARFAVGVERRAQHEPLAYILGHQEFYGLDFVVDRRVLIPRHETESLVQIALERSGRIASPVIVDIATGSGAIALTLAHHLPNATLYATDLSPDALAVAELNASRLHLDRRVTFINADLLNWESVTLSEAKSLANQSSETPALACGASVLRVAQHDKQKNESFDILVSNLPYIPSSRCDQLPPEIRQFEPRIALDGGADGLDVVRRLIGQFASVAKLGATALLEISEEQGDAALEIARHAVPHASVRVHQDLEGMDRVLEIRN